jgi:hypothetical protein
VVSGTEEKDRDDCTAVGAAIGVDVSRDHRCIEEVIP